MHWHRLAVDPYAGPVYTTGLRKRLPDYEEHGLFLAGMFSPPNYPERSMNGSVVAGQGSGKEGSCEVPGCVRPR